MTADELEARLNCFFDGERNDYDIQIPEPTEDEKRAARERKEALLASIDAIGCGDDDLSPDPRDELLERRLRLQVENKDFVCQGPDFSDPDVIRDVKPLIPYDRAFRRCRTLEAERDQLLAMAPHDLAQRHRLGYLAVEIARAQNQMKTEIARDMDENHRDRRRVDEWRVTDEGRAARRTVRTNANADLSDFTPEEKKARAAEQRYASNRRKQLAPKYPDPADLDAAVAASVKEWRAKKDR